MGNTTRKAILRKVDNIPGLYDKIIAHAIEVIPLYSEGLSIDDMLSTEKDVDLSSLSESRQKAIMHCLQLMHMATEAKAVSEEIIASLKII